MRGMLLAVVALALAWPAAGAEREASRARKRTPRPAPKPVTTTKSKRTSVPARKAVPKTDAKGSVTRSVGKQADTAKIKVVPVPPETGLVNSLGMRFVRYGELAVCIWPVRVGDYKYFGRATGTPAVPVASFVQGPDHPVVNVTWKDAVRFCEWLTESERLSGRLSADREYRLPTDREWSTFAGLGTESGATPEARDRDATTGR